MKKMVLLILLLPTILLQSCAWDSYVFAWMFGDHADVENIGYNENGYLEYGGYEFEESKYIGKYDLNYEIQPIEIGESFNGGAWRASACYLYGDLEAPISFIKIGQNDFIKKDVVFPKIEETPIISMYKYEEFVCKFTEREETYLSDIVDLNLPLDFEASMFNDDSLISHIRLNAKEDNFSFSGRLYRCEEVFYIKMGVMNEVYKINTEYNEILKKKFW